MAAVVAKNNGSGSATGLHAYAPDGIDVLANGSGRVQLGSHRYRTTNAYAGGEIHQDEGTLYAMVTPDTRRVLAGPASAGALHLIEPVRVYDSRRAAPSPGRLSAGTDRLSGRRVRVFCGAGSTHFLIDVVGYYL